MRHRVKGRKLKRTESHRLALMRSLSTSLLKHKRIKTTVAKAKETRSFIEPLITKAKKNDLHSKKLVIDQIKDKEAVKELFNEIVPKVGDRPGGYTRVIKLGNRIGDAAPMAIIELVDYNDVSNKRAEERRDKKEVKKTKEKEAEPQEEETVGEEVEANAEPKKEKKEKKKKTKGEE
jgi:large subunit ribosomal protein L17